MSHKTYDLLWRNAQDIVDEAARNDSIFQSVDRPETEKPQARPIVVELYIRYIIAANRLIECYDQIVQPQKLIVIRKLLDALLGRIVEIKYDLINIDQSDLNYINDDVMLRIGVTPMELELKIPTFFKNYREDWQGDWRRKLQEILTKSGYILEEDEGHVPLTEIEAVRLIQTHERARQGRLRAQFMREIRNITRTPLRRMEPTNKEFKMRKTILKAMKKKTKPEEEKDETGFGTMMAAIRIQKIWRGFVARRSTRKLKIAEMLLIGMLPPEKIETSAREKQKEICEYRRQLQKKNLEQYEQDLIKTKEKLKAEKSEAMMVEMKDEIQNWLQEYYNHSGKLPEFPSEERGGSRLMFSRLGFSTTQRSESELSKSISSKDSKGKKSKKSKDSSESKKKTSEDTEVVEENPKLFKPLSSNFFGEILHNCEEYEETWKNKNEKDNPSQEPYIDMIVKEKTSELEIELRRIVDDLMRDELENLQAALDRDRAGKSKKPKKASKKARRGGKKGKKKKEKDLTPDRTLESLFEELVLNGIIRQYPNYTLDDFKGERSFVPNSWGTVGDIRQLITEYCILPLGSQAVRENTPLIKSLLIAGAEGSGKKQLMYTVCSETDSVLFDISATNIVGKYPGKSGLTMLMHLVSKVSRLLQPSVIFIDQCEKTFVRKVQKGDKSDPKRLKKDLPKLIKGITSEDRVMLLGTTCRPWDCDQKLLVQTYQKFILIPKPNHADLVLIWKYLLSPYKLLKNFDCGSIARLSDGYTIGSIIKVVKEVMTCKRMVQLRSHPLKVEELVEALSKQHPIWKEHEEALKQWIRK